ncbi:hypothetical protein PTSG_02811 [Salpingoeca rosetta]|uniref:RING-type domain-containing protein n=1 Tax=Salpingoeca rosetta (strain ATCC 50818 / BSB-021) TaxID=946362 RepID=F2U3E3_SALR5|nr:uncharacterized protein PTSG_02811 [Salpingoeca rosetta]EGD82137.1 hypothetical protein PTSG_02811 [Salpingoeca rosetta]|eukprot:XP_004996320.1 hypothetical protein PTSG_02811 [Salpingoeca rosetta]
MLLRARVLAVVVALLLGIASGCTVVSASHKSNQEPGTASISVAAGPANLTRDAFYALYTDAKDINVSQIVCLRMETLLVLSGSYPSDQDPVPTLSITQDSGMYLWNVTRHESSGPWTTVKVTSVPVPPYYRWSTILINNAIFFFCAMTVSVLLVFSAMVLKRCCMHRHAQQRQEEMSQRVQTALDHLPTRQYDAAQDKTEEGDSSHDQCVVCLQNYSDGEMVRELDCHHLFHQACVDPWLMQHNTCPLCKRAVVEEDASNAV